MPGVALTPTISPGERGLIAVYLAGLRGLLDNVLLSVCKRARAKAARLRRTVIVAMVVRRCGRSCRSFTVGAAHGRDQAARMKL